MLRGFFNYLVIIIFETYDLTFPLSIWFPHPLAVSCGLPKAPVNGGVLAMDYSVGTRVTYFCNDGYRLSSKELTSAVCQPDGTWSNHNKVPRCSGTGHGQRGRSRGSETVQEEGDGLVHSVLIAYDNSRMCINWTHLKNHLLFFFCCCIEQEKLILYNCCQINSLIESLKCY